MNLKRLDHFVLTVRDIEATCAFYRDTLAMEVVTFGEGRVALRFGELKINLHEAGREFEPKATHPTPGSADLCFLTDAPLEQVVERLTTRGVALLSGIVPRTGARRPIRSIYLRDPDGNLIELANELQED
ncbi:MAG: VOC family protein [Candidatus Poribacteria bacterium]|nr:VOC family protein [Candidatus Poribacteria bacterium]